MQADLCYASAFDDTEESPVDTVSDDDAAVLSMEVPAAAAESKSVTQVTHGMTEVASAPSLLMMSVNVDQLPLTEAMSDVSLTAGDDGRPFAGKPQLDDAFYFYQGELIVSNHLSNTSQSNVWMIRGNIVRVAFVCLSVCLFFHTISQKPMQLGSPNLT